MKSNDIVIEKVQYKQDFFPPKNHPSHMMEIVEQKRADFSHV